MQISRRQSDGLIVQHGESVGEREGCDIVDLDDATAELVLAALAQPNGGVTITKDHKTVNALPAPAPAPVSDPDADRRTAIEAATTLNELKAALLGTNRPARVAGRPTGLA